MTGGSERGMLIAARHLQNGCKPTMSIARTSPPFALALAAALLASCASQPAAPTAPAKPAPLTGPVQKAVDSLYAGIRQETLPNGLRVFLKPVPGAATVSTMVAYNVGSADENLDHTGLSHYLEHLMFKGTEKVSPGDIDRMTLQNGGANNAYTDTDYTIFHFDFAADRWDAALVVEADRMQNLRIDARHEFEHEKGAVIQELRRNEDTPWDLEFKKVLPPLFGKGPYGHPVIGEAEHVHNATAEVIKAHYDAWYHPNNAALVIVGGIDADKTLARVKELFGPIPQATLPLRKVAEPAGRDQPVHVEFESKFSAPRMVMGFNTVKAGDPDDLTLDVLSQVLVGEKIGRLYETLVEKQVANSVGSFNGAGRYPGWFGITVELLPEQSREKTEQQVLHELRRLADQPVDAAELERAKRTIIAGRIFAHETVHGLADSIAQSVLITNLDYVREYLPGIAAVSAKQVQAAARKYFDPQRRVVVWSVPKPGAEGGGGGNETPAPKQRSSKFASDGGAEPLSLTSAKRVVLPNGLTLLLLENHRLPIVAAHAEVRDVVLHQTVGQAGIADLMGRMLSEGTDRHTGPQVAQTIQNVGGSLELDSTGGSVQVLSPDRELGLSLLIECLSRPSFPAEGFTREKQRQLSDIDDEQQQPDYLAKQAFAAAIYGDHPLGQPGMGTRKTVEPLTAGDLRKFHAGLFTPNNTLLAIVGDFDSKQVVDQVTALTRDWKQAATAKLSLPTVPMPSGSTERLISVPDAAQLHFLMGHPGVRRTSPDFYKLLVMDYVLGTGPGFTDRLTSRIRDREGLAYTVMGNITGSAGVEPGTFTCYVGTEPKNLARVHAEFLEEIRRLRAEAPTAAEVADAKAYLTGSLPFRLTTNGSIAGLLLQTERYGLGFDYLADYRRGVESVTPAEVQAVAQKYLDPDHMVTIAAGAIDQQGKPLPAPSEPPPQK
jgi:zinc protease